MCIFQSEVMDTGQAIFTIHGSDVDQFLPTKSIFDYILPKQPYTNFRIYIFSALSAGSQLMVTHALYVTLFLMEYNLVFLIIFLTNLSVFSFHVQDTLAVYQFSYIIIIQIRSVSG